MSEKENKPKKTSRIRVQTKTKGKSALEVANENLVSMFTTTVHMLEETLKSGKLNPAQGLLGMMLVADLLHGGAYVCPNCERPFLVGKDSKYYGSTGVGATDFFPVPGLNILDITGSLLGIEGAVAENKVGQMITAEVYMNANCPHKFPKLLSDEVYAKILVMSEFLAHTDVVMKSALGVKTFVEASAIPVQTLGKATEQVGKGLKDLAPLLSLLDTE